MDSIMKYVSGFFSGLLGIMMAIFPVTILWQVLTGTNVFGMDVIAVYHMEENNNEIFEGKTFESLLKDIYTNSTRKEKQIQILITELKPMIKNIGDAVIIVPLIKDYMEIAVKNDEALIKMAAIVQKAQNRSGNDGDNFMLTEAEKEQLIAEVGRVGVK